MFQKHLNNSKFLVVIVLSTVFANSIFCSEGFFSKKLHRAVEGDRFDEVRSMIENNPQFFAPYFVSVLHKAAMLGFSDIVAFLVEQGADVNARDDGWTSLHWTTAKGHLSIAQFLY